MIKEEKNKQAKEQKKIQEKQKMEQATKKLKIDLDRIRAKARKVQQMSKKWECDSDEKKWLSFIPDSNSDGDVKIDVNKCFRCDIAFKKKEKEVYGCDHCP